MTILRDTSDETIGQVAGRLVDDAKSYARAELDALKAMAGSRVRSARMAIVMGVGAIFVAQAGLTVLFIAIGAIVATFLNPWAGLLIAAVLAFAIAGLMVMYAVKHISPAAALPDPQSEGGR